jgi:hypothetical protein
MRYELRTTFAISSDGFGQADAVDTPDKVVRWLYEYLPTKATLGSDVARPRWVGSRYSEEPVFFQLLTHYRDVFAATADGLRIAEAMRNVPASVKAVTSVEFHVLRVFGDRELVDWADPTKPKVSIP